MKKSTTIITVAGIFLFLFFITGPLYILEEGYQAVVTQFGKVIKTETNAGLKLKTPFIDTVIKYPKKILAWDGDSQRIPTLEKQYIKADVTARWKIADLNKFYESCTTFKRAYANLDSVIDSSVRTIISQNSLRESVRNSDIINEIERENFYTTKGQSEEDSDFNELTEETKTYDAIQKGRLGLSEEILALAKEDVLNQFGIELLDIVIRQIRYSDDLTESVYNRMIKERNKIAQAFRSKGEGLRDEWLGKLENDQKTIQSKAYAESEKIKGTADATAARTYSRAYNQNPEFFEFWRAIESYKNTMPKFEKTITTDMDYFKYLYNKRGR